ncbi:GNAT family N-acetyltransferase [Ancylobacter sp. 6x-1]|uniref:GNAT family N-acetyltransferase n=1 Tax=Ancylobacter crimeensis TaxID=2579147 RepID=A0ABT0D768_9HYPH|nr:GNAT family N-acetyltransferase [Ancylobacter crimeensis]MCK0195796.1 GNAT family N-acetyltransferase [Ancylobacter crimeensis]
MLSYSSVFDEPWWYEAATGGSWRKVEFDDGKVLAASLVYSTYREGGLRIVGMPHLARVMQPTIKFHSVEARRNLSHVIRALQGLSEQLPKFDRFSYTLAPDSDLDLAFNLAGFTVTTSFTFRTRQDPDYDPLREMDQKVRYNIKTGLKRMQVVEHTDVERYIRLSQSFIGDRAFKDNVDYGAIRRIMAAAVDRGQAIILACVDETGADMASAVLLTDSRYLYYWLNSRNPAANEGAANSVLIWKSIEKARALGLTFDMDGYAKANTGVFLSRFGLIPQRRSEISMVTNAATLRMAAASHVRSLVGPKLRQKLLSIRNTVSGRKSPMSQAS